MYAGDYALMHALIFEPNDFEGLGNILVQFTFSPDSSLGLYPGFACMDWQFCAQQLL